MSTDIAKERLASGIQELYASDPQFAVARPDEAASAAIERPGVRLPQLVQTVMEAVRFQSAVQDAKIGPDKDIPHVTREVVIKYATDLHLLGLL
jgi:hypothetical protein